MRIDCKSETITCKCGNQEHISHAKIFRYHDNNLIHFKCRSCEKIQKTPIELNNFFEDLLLKYSEESEQEFGELDNDFGDIFLGQNQIPLTDELIDTLVKNHGMDKEELLYMKKKGAMYSTSRGSFIFPIESNFDEPFD